MFHTRLENGENNGEPGTYVEATLYTRSRRAGRERKGERERAIEEESSPDQAVGCRLNSPVYVRPRE